RLGNDILGTYRKSLPDLGGESWQIVVHRFQSSDQACDQRSKSFSLMATAAAAWVYGLVSPRAHEQLCGQAKGHARLVSPYLALLVVRAFVPTHTYQIHPWTQAAPTTSVAGAVLFPR